MAEVAATEATAAATTVPTALAEAAAPKATLRAATATADVCALSLQLPQKLCGLLSDLIAHVDVVLVHEPKGRERLDEMHVVIHLRLHHLSVALAQQVAKQHEALVRVVLTVLVL